MNKLQYIAKYVSLMSFETRNYERMHYDILLGMIYYNMIIEYIDLWGQSNKEMTDYPYDGCIGKLISMD